MADSVAERPIVVLVVDDVSDTRRMYGTYFTHVGAEVLFARDGAEALDVLHRSRPDAVLLDLSMPHVPGWDVLKAIRAERATARLPVVALTGYVAPGVERAVLDAGADVFLTKPCLPGVAFNLIAQLVHAERRV